MLYRTENVKLKQLAFLLIGSGFKRCEVWNEKEYLETHHRTKRWKILMIREKQVELLQKMGASREYAERMVFLQGNPPVNKKTLSLLGNPIWFGSIDELSNQHNLWNENIRSIYITGLFRNKIDIVIKQTDFCGERRRDSKLLMLIKEYEKKQDAVEQAKRAYADFKDFDNEEVFEEIQENFFNAQNERDYVANTICNYLLLKEN